MPWSSFLAACKSRLFNCQEFCELVDAMLVAWNQSEWEYLYHRNQQALQVRALFPPESCLLNICQHVTDVCLKTTRNRLIAGGVMFLLCLRGPLDRHVCVVCLPSPGCQRFSPPHQPLRARWSQAPAPPSYLTVEEFASPLYDSSRFFLS